MKDKYFSIKQIAEHLGVTKQQVYRCIKKHCITEAHTEVVSGNTVLMYDNEAFIRISSILFKGCNKSNETHEPHHEAPNEAPNETPYNDTVNGDEPYKILYETLLKQIEVKDKQIEDLLKALDQAQKLNAIDKQKILELEDKMSAAAAVQKQDQGNHEQETEPLKEKKKWWQKILF